MSEPSALPSDFRLLAWKQAGIISAKAVGGEGPEALREAVNALIEPYEQLEAQVADLTARLQTAERAQPTLKQIFDIAQQTAEAITLGDIRALTEVRARVQDAIYKGLNLDPERAQTWQPIATAPKDGTRFIGIGTYDAKGERWEGYETWWGTDGHRREGWCFGSDFDEHPDLWRPKHWMSMPFPDPPRARTEQEPR